VQPITAESSATGSLPGFEAAEVLWGEEKRGGGRLKGRGQRYVKPPFHQATFATALGFRIGRAESSTQRTGPMGGGRTPTLENY